MARSVLNSIEQKTANPHEDFVKKKKKMAPVTAGPKWFDMKAPIITPELKNEVDLINMRNVLSYQYRPKKDEEELPKFFEVGTVIEGPTDYFSRETKRQKNKSLVDHLLEDQEARKKIKKMYSEITEKKGGMRARRLKKKKDSKNK